MGLQALHAFHKNLSFFLVISTQQLLKNIDKLVLNFQRHYKICMHFQGC